MVWAYEVPRWVAHTLRQMGGLSVGDEKEVGAPREQHHANASGGCTQQRFHGRDCLTQTRRASRHEGNGKADKDGMGE